MIWLNPAATDVARLVFSVQTDWAETRHTWLEGGAAPNSSRHATVRPLRPLTQHRGPLPRLHHSQTRQIVESAEDCLPQHL